MYLEYLQGYYILFSGVYTIICVCAIGFVESQTTADIF
jgi:hypothetical protein